MTPSLLDSPDLKNNSRMSGLVVWLILVPLAVLLLVCISQAALVVGLRNIPMNTLSKLSAAYQEWAYGEIPSVDEAAFLEDVEREGTPVVEASEEGVFWIPPTPTAVAIAQETGTPARVTPSPTPEQATITPVTTRTPTQTPFVVTVTRRPTITRTTRPSATITATSTRRAYLPTWTDTPEPPPPPPSATHTGTVSPTPSVTPTLATLVTPSVTVSPTASDTAEVIVTITPITPTLPTPTYAPVRPIAENNGESFVNPDGPGCLARFGYRNDNPFEVDIPIGERNRFLTAPDFVFPEQPSHFLTDRISSAFSVVWTTENTPFIWYLDGREARAEWCTAP